LFETQTPYCHNVPAPVCLYRQQFGHLQQTEDINI